MSSREWPAYSPFTKQLFDKGKVEGEAVAVIRILKARGINVPQDAHDRITECKDPDQMEEWIVRAATATTLDDVFAPNTA
ncbi:hypothetical protein [Nonomuraea guangzhouensis]|uniref:Uncharacterized protein n=1 Tax=Nonomuraea guangzhouensis TaxID=1291555 RepID=A0ABW4GMA4_9ACTN|nr:hypothetical protein [Nonomuraea guangzhouensis]